MEQQGTSVGGAASGGVGAGGEATQGFAGALPARPSLLALIVFGAVDVLATGFGMGVPFFTIILGFFVGGWLAGQRDLRFALRWSAIYAGLTFVMMAVIWGPKFALLADPAFSAKDFGIPLILYTSTASFLGWQALMIFGGPVLQFMASATSAAVRSVRRSGEPGRDA